MKRVTLVIACVAGCSWSTFDDLSDTTWAHAQEKPDTKETDYGVSVVGATLNIAGRVGVLGNGPPTYSTIEMSADGSTSSANVDGLNNHSIDALSARPILIGDGAGNVAVIDKGVDGAIIAVHGVATQLADTQVGTQQPPDSATFAGADILIAATATPPPAPVSANLFVITAAGGVVSCILVDDTSTPVAFAAIAADSTNVYVWNRTGVVMKVALTMVEACTSGSTVAVDAATFTGPAIPGTNGAQIDLIGDPAKFAVLSSFDTSSTATGQIDVVNLTSFTEVGTPVAATGARSTALGNLGGTEVVAIGFPGRAVGSTAAAGEVELHAIDTTTGVLDSDTTEVLSIPQADDNLQFGRSITTAKFNAQSILVVGASGVVYAYFQTSLYANTRQ